MMDIDAGRVMIWFDHSIMETEIFIEERSKKEKQRAQKNKQYNYIRDETQRSASEKPANIT